MPYRKALAIVFIAVFLAVLSGCSSLNGQQTDRSESRASSTTESAQPLTICDEPAWKALYVAELEKHIGSLSPKFNICDLDGDGVPELLISDDDYHALGGEIYTVNDGALCDLGDYGSWGEFQYDPINKYIWSGCTGQGESYTTVYMLENGKMIEIVSFYDNMGAAVDTSSLEFKVNGKPVTKDIYQAELAMYGFSDYESPFVQKYDITESEISQVMDEY